MSAVCESNVAVDRSEVEFSTFYIGDLLVGVDILQIEEINRLAQVTAVPHTPDDVRGVVNLRGEVVTVVDLRTILNVSADEACEQPSTIVVNSHGEQIGLLVDRVADVTRCTPREIDAAPANVNGVDGRFFKGIYKLETELMVILDLDVVLASECSS
jgi:purine-binding chemotaxis protein CheW